MSSKPNSAAQRVFARIRKRVESKFDDIMAKAASKVVVVLIDVGIDVLQGIKEALLEEEPASPQVPAPVAQPEAPKEEEKSKQY